MPNATPKHIAQSGKTLSKVQAGIGLRLLSFTVAELATAPYAAALHPGAIVECSNGADGSKCLAYSNGTAWVRVLLGAAVDIS